MNAQTPKLKTVEQALAELPSGLALLRAPFPANQISKLPKPTKAQTEAVSADYKKGIRCKDCGAWHHPEVVHLDYVGHAALTDRLLDVDPAWSWEPVALTDTGLPAFDQSGGLWIRLTVLGVSRLGYGHAKAKPNQDPGAREKEVIGDALRNAAMRFGAALDLWHKGDLHADGEDQPSRPTPKADPAPPGIFINDAQRDQIVEAAEAAGVALKQVCGRYGIDALPELHADMFERCLTSLRKAAEARKQPADILDDSIPY